MEEKNTNEITSTNTKETTAQPIEEPVQSEQKASENKNTNKQKKGNRLLIVLLVLIVLGAIGYIVYDKIIASDKPNNEVNEVNKNKETNNTNNTDNNDNNNLNNNNTNNGSFTELDCHDGNGCEFTKGNFNFKIVNLENESITGEALYINGNKVLEDGWIIFYEENFLVLNDIAIVHIGEGLDHWTTFKIYDLQGNLLLDGKTIDSKFGENMLLSVLDDNVKPIYLEGNKIKINATRFSHGPSILGEDGLINKNTSCDTVVMGTYEIEYYGNGSLSEIKNTGYVTLRESINNYGYDYNNYVNCD